MFRLKINSEICKGCLYCVKNCSKQVFQLSGRSNSRGSQYVEASNAGNCIGCKICTLMCPDAAIELFEVEE